MNETHSLGPHPGSEQSDDDRLMLGREPAMEYVVAIVITFPSAMIDSETVDANSIVLVPPTTHGNLLLLMTS